MRDAVTFKVNGVEHVVRGADVFQPLSSYLRYQSRLTGTKVVCAEGDCGACTVMVARPTPQSGTDEKFTSINSCIAMTFAMDGAILVTVEGLKDGDGLSEIQDSMVRNFGGQCGFCTPGFVMSMTNLVEQKKDYTEDNVRNYLTGNLCRCTGYTPIIKAAMDIDRKKVTPLSTRYPIAKMPMLREPILIQSAGCEFYAPTSLAEACAYKNRHSDVTVFSGSTDLGVQFNKGHIRPNRILSLHLIPETYRCELKNGEAFIGARVSLSCFQDLIETAVPSLARFLNIFASPQIKNAGTLVGNIANGSPIADMTPPMMALDAELDLVGVSGKRTVALTKFYLDYKKLDLKPDEIIEQIRFKVPSANWHFENFKVSQRRDLDISTVNASLLFQIAAGNPNGKILAARIAVGGVAPTTLRLFEVEKSLAGKPWTDSTVEDLKVAIRSAVKPLNDVRGSAEYRSTLVGNLVTKFARTVRPAPETTP